MDGCFWEGTLGDQPFTTTNKGKIFRRRPKRPLDAVHHVPLQGWRVAWQTVGSDGRHQSSHFISYNAGSLVSHQLSPEEVEAASRGS